MGNEEKRKQGGNPLPGSPDTGAGNPKKVKKDCKSEAKRS